MILKNLFSNDASLHGLSPAARIAALTLRAGTSIYDRTDLKRTRPAVPLMDRPLPSDVGPVEGPKGAWLTGVEESKLNVPKFLR